MIHQARIRALNRPHASNGRYVLYWMQASQRAHYNLGLYLNNKYELDGRDPNGYAGVARCLGRHDRPWQARPILGKIRYMSAGGLERKFDIGSYVQQIGAREASEQARAGRPG